MLETNLDSFHWAKCNISKEFSGSRGSQIENNLVLVCTFFSHGVGIKVLEDFIETEFASSLHRVTNEGWGPTTSKSLGTTFGNGYLKISFFSDFYTEKIVYNSAIQG